MNETDREKAIRYGPTEFRHDMDPYALDIERNGVRIGSLQWHPESPRRVVLDTGESPLLALPVNLLEDIVKKSQEIK
jgi:hypothetical protein